mmetsp:Transcript_2523/g.8445  ORF Transcript_2523/g.8445 Transcript_2523/m.8445 type:complete len:383 (+) Transcript_2523:62-1210(+)|eukprot:CAMPEP_0204582990 /NCGR_PEP_ID=MMETSP0661-20131031/45526_1 /ASSEMBLY_ACC=CAM_ASM_000606 /TAXON_ID=109239 /ORGANISM="Alexandrium margalefi, Strain AMGDE01CS-322" /LENGTH=382 /DNA_ID=CAMNT_0051592313 /DNA_START=60 /DNA_END=1208 /DNA_ORIENTATION=-
MLPHAIRGIQRLAQRPLQPVTIRQLLARSAAVSEAGHVSHAAWLREEMPVRLAHRLANFLHLPFVVVCNAHFHEVFRLFLHAFESLTASPPVTDAESVVEFSRMLRSLVRGHDEIVHMLQEGYGELQVMLDDLVDLDAFLNQTFKTRIGNRVLAEHFLAVHEARQQGRASECTGIVLPACCPAEIVDRLAYSLGGLCRELYGVEPRVQLEGQLETTLSFVPDHLTFMMQEILKNAFRATIERHIHSPSGLPPVIVEVMKGSFDVNLKVSDCGGGMRREKLEQIWRYGYTTTGLGSGPQDDGGALGSLCGQDASSFRQIAGYGFGLPLSRVYAQYFGGDIIVQSMHGYGTDVYLNINHLGDVSEACYEASEANAGQHERIVAN